MMNGQRKFFRGSGRHDRDRVNLKKCGASPINGKGLMALRSDL